MNNAARILFRLILPLGIWLIAFSSLLALVPEYAWHNLMRLWIGGIFLVFSAAPLPRPFQLLLAAIFLPLFIFFVANFSLSSWPPFFQLVVACAIFGMTALAALSLTLYYNRKYYLT